MTIYNRIIFFLWIFFAAFWAIAALGVKRSSGRRPWRPEVVYRLVVVAAMIVLLRDRSGLRAVRAARLYAAQTPLLGFLGVALCVLGVGLAIWARIHLGRNWGMPGSRKQQPEIVTSGPYAYIRHPIYSGVLLAMVGSAFGESPIWGLALLFVPPYFIYCARREEHLMLEEFPTQYAAYMRRTRMLLPRLRRHSHAR